MLISFPLIEAVKGPSKHPVRESDPESHRASQAQPPQIIPCPECAGPIALSARCRTCVACGWSRCN